jgi:hypothetical protein
MAVDIGDRYPTVKEFASAFRSALLTKTIEARPARKPHIFFSYHRESSAGWAVHFASELRRKYGVTVFVDTEQQDTGPFPDRLRDEIRSCDFFVCFLAEATLRSSWVDEEIRTAFTCSRQMLPVFQESFDHHQVSSTEAHVKALLAHQGVHLLDRRAIHVPHTVSEIAKMIRRSSKGTMKRTKGGKPGAARG